MHALPALTDACAIYPGVEFDWVVDESFAEVPSWHPAVRNIYKSAHRRWRRSFFNSLSSGELFQFYRQLNEHEYDVIIDAQNNVKSSFISWLRKGAIHGMDKDSVAEQPAFLAYKNKHFIDKNLHAIDRQRQLFASALGYKVPDFEADYGIRSDAFHASMLNIEGPFLFLVHNASWTTKLWPEDHWHALIGLAATDGYQVVLPGGSSNELARAAELAAAHENAVALPRMSLSEIGGIIQKADGAICCDTGLAHLTAITGIPAVTLYGPTSEKLIGTTGRNQQHLAACSPPYTCAPCYKRSCHFGNSPAAMSACMNAFSPKQVWSLLKARIAEAKTII